MKQTTERIDKFLSHAGIASRSHIKGILKKHTITVNGVQVKSSGFRINLDKDRVLLDGQEITKTGFLYFMLNKPRDVISTVYDKLGRTTVVDLIETSEKIYPVGRLDKDTHGLVLLTNDGNLTHKLIHPKYHVPKVYRLTVAQAPSEEQLQIFRNGVMLRDGITLPAQIKIKKQTKTSAVLEITLHEGRNRQIRRMCEALLIELLDLQRIAFGPLKLGILKEGAYRELTEKELTQLKHAVQILK